VLTDDAWRGLTADGEAPKKRLQDVHSSELRYWAGQGREKLGTNVHNKKEILPGGEKTTTKVNRNNG